MDDALRMCLKEVSENGGTMTMRGSKDDGTIAFLVLVTREADVALRVIEAADTGEAEG